MFRFNERQTLPNAFVTLENTLRTFSIRSEQTLNRPRRNITYDYTHQIFTVLFTSSATRSDSFISARLGIQVKADFLKDGVSIEFQPKSHFFAQVLTNFFFRLNLKRDPQSPALSYVSKNWAESEWVVGDVNKTVGLNQILDTYQPIFRKFEVLNVV